ncbi:MAG: hypothetical protein GOVbin2917_50 [Prokaryotic dsDNA virus sp.]|jgi:uncharacterized protein YfiM (DUF2279 family)|nr:MAG: hypothetical protein GOVbin2917_50 [Prokaryotic dsDNA virus sp.]|tara:strand:+ start:75427 stop:76080 length:654 start_codon:yes stop_codon:yes gene_type:complete
MLKFINEDDFLKVDTFKENEDGSVTWVWDEGEGLPTHSGIIREGFKRYTQEQQGTVEAVVGQDDEGNDIVEEQPKMVDVEIDVWSKLWQLHDDESIEINVLPVDLDLLKENAKQVVNSQRDSLISGGVLHNGYTFQTDATSIMDIMGAIMSGIDTTWLTADNQQVPMSSVDMQALGQAVALHKETSVFKARVHKDNIESLATKAEIDDYVANLSWVD